MQIILFFQPHYTKIDTVKNPQHKNTLRKSPKTQLFPSHIKGGQIPESTIIYKQMHISYAPFWNSSKLEHT